MSTILSPQMLRQVEERATERCMVIVHHLIDALIEDGQTYGDVSANKPEEFVPFYLDLHRRGVCDTLAVVNPALAAKWRRKFQNDAAKLMGLRNGR